MKPTARKLTLLALALALGLAAPACKPHRRKEQDLPACEDDRIRKIYAIPSTLLLIDSTRIEVETFDERLTGDPAVTFTLRADGRSKGRATLAPLETCADGSAACYGVTCVGIGKSTDIDEETGLPSAAVRVGVTVADDECRDESEIWIQCLKPSDEQICNTCLEHVDVAEAAALGSACLGPLLLDGDDGYLETGCLGDDACSALWSCQQATLCHVPNAAACYCGPLDELGACSDPSFAPAGACEAQTRDAFTAQLMREPASNGEVLSQMFNMLAAPSGFPSLAVANMLSSDCLLPDGPSAPPKTRALLEASGLSHDAVETCIRSCF